MIGWLTLKMVTNWNRPRDEEIDRTTGALSALLAGLVSMMFALIGGLIVNGTIRISCEVHAGFGRLQGIVGWESLPVR